MKRITKEDAKRAKSNHTVKMMLKMEHHKKVVSWTRAKVARDFKRYSLRNTLLIAVSEDCEKAEIWRSDGDEVGGHWICLQAIPARMSCDNVLEYIGEGSTQGVQEPRPQPWTTGRGPQRPAGGRRV